MQKLGIYLGSLIILSLLVALGCTDRGANKPVASDVRGGYIPIQHAFPKALQVQINNPSQQLFVNFYTPHQGFLHEPMPLVILLGPQDSDEFYFFNHGLIRLADELISTGQIVPMGIACVGNDQVFGGYFWSGNGGGSGDYNALLGDSLLEYIYGNDPELGNTLRGLFINSPNKRGIGGVGMGSYGAFRTVMLNPGEFTSITVTDGPLDFDGADGNSGLMSLIDNALNEQGLLGSANWRRDFDTSGVWHVSRLFIGGALAFSPHDTLVFPIVTQEGRKPEAPYADTTIILEVDTVDPGPPVVLDTTRLDTIIDTLRWIIHDSTTLIENIVSPADFNFDFHLPFNGSGNVYQPIWDLWLRNNLETMLLDKGTNVFNGVDMWFGTTIDPAEQSLTYGYQTRSWINTLQTAGAGDTLAVFEYTGYDPQLHPAASDQYLYDLLKEMLIFHSNNFRETD